MQSTLDTSVAFIVVAASVLCLSDVILIKMPVVDVVNHKHLNNSKHVLMKYETSTMHNLASIVKGVTQVQVKIHVGYTSKDVLKLGTVLLHF